MITLKLCLKRDQDCNAGNVPELFSALCKSLNIFALELCLSKLPNRIFKKVQFLEFLDQLQFLETGTLKKVPTWKVQWLQTYYVGYLEHTDRFNKTILKKLQFMKRENK